MIKKSSLFLCFVSCGLIAKALDASDSERVQKGGALMGLACDSTTHRCNAVGYYYYANVLTIAPFNYITEEISHSWRVNTFFTLPSDVEESMAHGVKLTGVSCDSAGLKCVVIGQYNSEEHQALTPLAYTSENGGKNWHLSLLPPLINEDGLNMYRVLRSVKCDNAGLYCVAVGQYLNKMNHAIPFSMTSGNEGSTWSFSEPIVLPEDMITKPFVDDELSIGQVTCDGNDVRCTMVGSYTSRRDGHVLPLSYASVDGGHNWVLSDSLPLPDDVALESSEQRSGLSSVACDTEGVRCTAVGTYVNDGFQVVPLGYHSEDGGHTWLLSTKLPLSKFGRGISDVQGVACSAKGLQCVAVGSYQTDGFSFEPLGYFSTDGGRSWKMSRKLELPKMISIEILAASLSSVVCDAEGINCTAVGRLVTKVKNAPLSYDSSDGGQTWVLNEKMSDVGTENSD